MVGHDALHVGRQTVELLGKSGAVAGGCAAFFRHLFFMFAVALATHAQVHSAG